VRTADPGAATPSATPEAPGRAFGCATHM
jgi:hypothetical protein